MVNHRLRKCALKAWCDLDSSVIKIANKAILVSLEPATKIVLPTLKQATWAPALALPAITVEAVKHNHARTARKSVSCIFRFADQVTKRKEVLAKPCVLQALLMLVGKVVKSSLISVGLRRQSVQMTRRINSHSVSTSAMVDFLALARCALETAHRVAPLAWEFYVCRKESSARPSLLECTKRSRVQCARSCKGKLRTMSSTLESLQEMMHLSATIGDRSRNKLFYLQD